MGATFAGTLKFGFFTGLWVGSLAVVPLLLALALSGHTAPFAAWCLLALFRRVVPARPWDALRDVLCLDETPYFSSQHIVFAEGKPPPAGDARVLCFHPHGLLCCAWTLGNTCSALRTSSVSWLAADSLLALPLISDFLRCCATLPVSAPTFRRLLALRTNVALLPGGFEEATLFARGRERVFIKSRRGFIKLALQHGASLQPCYGFGESHTYHAFTGFLRLRLWLCSFRVPAVAGFGTLRTAFLPFLPDASAKMTLVVGKPLRLPRIEDPSAADVATWHGAYVAALTELFDAHKDKYGHGAPLELF